MSDIHVDCERTENKQEMNVVCIVHRVRKSWQTNTDVCVCAYKQLHGQCLSIAWGEGCSMNLFMCQRDQECDRMAGKMYAHNNPCA